MNTTELFEKMDLLYEIFKAEQAGTTKAAHARARKTLGEMKKVITEYRKTSTAEGKAK
jgi:hypothetical protein